jgi:hypothetical protein
MRRGCEVTLIYEIFQVMVEKGVIGLITLLLWFNNFSTFVWCAGLFVFTGVE